MLKLLQLQAEQAKSEKRRKEIEARLDKEEADEKKEAEKEFELAKRHAEEAKFANDDCGIPIFAKRDRKRPKHRLPEHTCHMRHYLSQYCIVLLCFATFTFFYSKIFCDGDNQFIEFGTEFEDPKFAKYETRITCPNVWKSAETYFIALFTLLTVQVHKKLYLALILLVFLLYFGFETRKIKVELSEQRARFSVMGRNEQRTQVFEHTMLVLHQILLIPLIFGEYFLLRHVYQDPTPEERRKTREVRRREKKNLARLQEEEQDYAAAIYEDLRAKEQKKLEEEREEMEMEEEYKAAVARVAKMDEVYKRNKEASMKRRRAKWAQYEEEKRKRNEVHDLKL